MTDSGVMHSLRSLLLLGFLSFTACSAREEPSLTNVVDPVDSTSTSEAPAARLALEPGDDAAELGEQQAVVEGVEDAPAEALASTEGIESPAPVDASDESDEPVEQVAGSFETLVNELVGFVERERGHRFDEPPVVTRLDDQAFAAVVAARTASDAERFREEFDSYTLVYRALGILAPDQDLAGVWESFGDAGITAIYDPDTGQISVRDDDASPLLRTSLIFELTRALDDQEFGIGRLDASSADTEVEWSRAALVHGSAAEITNRYRASMTADDLAEEQRELDGRPRNVSLSVFTNSFLELQFGRQFVGEASVERLWAQGQQAVDAALANPPATSEELIEGVAAPANAAVATPPADGSAFASGVWGQAGWLALFTELEGPDEAQADSTGWGGDAWTAWEVGTVSCVRLHVAADTPEDLDRYAELILLWAELGDRDVFFPTADLIRVTACG
jgi:hypothetical protein